MSLVEFRIVYYLEMNDTVGDGFRSCMHVGPDDSDDGGGYV